MSNAGAFIAALEVELCEGNVSEPSVHHLRHEVRRMGRNARDERIAASVGEEIERLEREAATLRRLRALYFGAI